MHLSWHVAKDNRYVQAISLQIQYIPRMRKLHNHIGLLETQRSNGSA